jgi:sodium transport system permease protein
MDIVAGEKERGSLETLLTTAARREEIVAAKQLAILAVALVITLIQVANILVYLNLKVIELPQDWIIEVQPITIITLLFLFIPFAAFFSAILLMISAYAKSYKEAQLYFFPVYLVSLVPALAAVLPGISLRSAIALVPVANVSVAAREIMVGKFDWPMLALAVAAMSAAAVWAMRTSARMLSQERLITASEADAADLAGGAALFPKHVLRWYAVMGVIMFGVALNVPQLGTMRSQILFNELAIFLVIPLLMIRWYRLDFRKALALRPVKPLAWLATLLVIPSANIVGVGVFRLANLFLPVPERVLEEFGRTIIPEGISTWQLIFFVAILPGICEEIGFRGTLLYGLHRRFRPITLAIVIGIIFGFFHTALFRILPTAFLGVILTALALLTGSILPGILLHAGNNAMGVLLGKSEIPLHELGWWIYLVAAFILGLAFYILYRVRTPYPGLRTD